MKNKSKVNIDKQTEKVAELITTLFKEVETIAHIRINSIVDKEEVKNLYMKIEIKKDMIFELSLFNSSTNSLVIKPYDFTSFITLCKLNMLNTVIDMDVENLYKKSLLKVYDDITNIYLE